MGHIHGELEESTSSSIGGKQTFCIIISLVISKVISEEPPEDSE